MFIQRLAHIFIKKGDSCVDNTAKALDWITALALLIIGGLGVCGMMPMSCALAHAFFGAGIVYTAVMLMTESWQSKCSIGN